jgi:c-di-GMP-binding flagellar brake protein YcgR
VERQNQIGSSPTSGFVDARCHPRFELDVEIKIYSRTSGLLLGRTVDISEGGMSAMLKIEVPLSEIVQLEFRLPFGFVAVRALVRHRNAFRYGFQFFEPDREARELINRTCYQ